MAAKVERLVNLTVALLEARQPMSLAELKRRTGFYAQDDERAARRMFERDKDELRRLGVPITTAALPYSDEVGYRIARRDYELPDVDLSAEEVAALALAVRLTGADGTPLALAKLAARAPDPAELPEPTTQVQLADDPIDAVADAIVHHIPVRFGYRTAAGTVGERRVDPYAVVRRRTSAYLVGRDHARDALRAFRLDRMTDLPQTIGEPGAFEPPADLDVAAAVQGPEVVGTEVKLAVTSAARWAVELRGGRDTGRTHDGVPVLALSGMHPVRDRSWILGLGPDVTVLSPPELREDVRSGLRAVAAASVDAGTDS